MLQHFNRSAVLAGAMRHDKYRSVEAAVGTISCLAKVLRRDPLGMARSPATVIVERSISNPA
jgi:hypothetical protein